MVLSFGGTFPVSLGRKILESLSYIEEHLWVHVSTEAVAGASLNPGGAVQAHVAHEAHPRALKHGNLPEEELAPLLCPEPRSPPRSVRVASAWVVSTGHLASPEHAPALRPACAGDTGPPVPAGLWLRHAAAPQRLRRPRQLPRRGF